MRKSEGGPKAASVTTYDAFALSVVQYHYRADLRRWQATDSPCLTTRCLPRPQARGADPGTAARCPERVLAGPLSSKPLAGCEWKEGIRDDKTEAYAPGYG